MMRLSMGMLTLGAILTTTACTRKPLAYEFYGRVENPVVSFAGERDARNATLHKMKTKTPDGRTLFEEQPAGGPNFYWVGECREGKVLLPDPKPGTPSARITETPAGNFRIVRDLYASERPFATLERVYSDNRVSYRAYATLHLRAGDGIPTHDTCKPE